tara:strand:+ start:28332 stop:28778 length:447 start_codon:yes stop_codon:yes gene_type:complete
VSTAAKFYFGFFILVFFTGCGATPGLTTTKKTIPNAPSYTYIDTKGNTYSISQNKFIYDPVSEDDTIDGLDDEGYHQELNISLNDYAKIAAACDRQFQETQKELPANYNGNVIPTLLRRYPDRTDELTLSIEGVDELDYILIPYLGDE